MRSYAGFILANNNLNPEVQMTPQRKSRFRWRQIVLLAIPFVAIFLMFRLDSRLEKTSPADPNQDSGQIYPLDSHGHTVYLTDQQNSQRNGTMNKLEVAFFAGIVLLGVEEWLSGRPPRALPEEPSS